MPYVSNLSSSPSIPYLFIQILVIECPLVVTFSLILMATSYFIAKKLKIHLFDNKLLKNKIHRRKKTRGSVVLLMLILNNLCRYWPFNFYLALFILHLDCGHRHASQCRVSQMMGRIRRCWNTLVW